jgi:hypothetical protein
MVFKQPFAGADPGFQVRGAHLKKWRRAEGGAKIFGVFRVKNHDFTPKNHIFSNFRGGAPGAPPPLDPPLIRHILFPPGLLDKWDIMVYKCWTLRNDIIWKYIQVQIYFKYANIACCRFLEIEGYWFTSVMLENRGNNYLTYFIIWGNGKSINTVTPIYWQFIIHKVHFINRILNFDFY